jgi:predicted nucleotidyltransferase component of viral defense system
MKRLKQYATPEAFKHALETRIRKASTEAGMDLARYRQLLIFDRFLARIFEEFQDRAVAKGGVVLELRLERARTTRDVDLRLVGSPEGLLEQLQRAGRRDLSDHLSFIVIIDSERPTLEGEGMVYDGQRFRAECLLAGKLYGNPFGVDIAFGDVLTVAPEIIEGSRFLEFAGIAPARLRIYPREAHIAEKLHAYTLPRRNENSRVKDLPDLALLATTGPFEATKLRTALERTFKFRDSHRLPANVPRAPASWARIYARMATDDDLPWSTLEAVETAVQRFLDPILGEERGTWDPKAWSWSASR